MFLVLISWVIFAFEDLSQVGNYLSTMFDLNGASIANPEAIYYLKNYIVIIIIGIICSIPIVQVLKNRIETIASKESLNNKGSTLSNELLTKKSNEKNNDTDSNLSPGKNQTDSKLKNNKKVKALMYTFASLGYVAIILLSTASLVNNSFNPFLYFRF